MVHSAIVVFHAHLLLIAPLLLWCILVMVMWWLLLLLNNNDCMEYIKKDNHMIYRLIPELRSFFTIST